jgi:hypothetical protein
MADDQLARRYPDPEFAGERLLRLCRDGVISRWWDPLEDSRVYSPTRLARITVGLRNVRPHTTFRSHLAHDVAVVDLADTLLASDPALQWVTEDELWGFLEGVAPHPGRLPGDTRHRPDGLLLSGSERVAIELEHTDKSEHRYMRISSWFVREWRVDRVRWFVDNDRARERLRRVNANHGFDLDMKIEIEAFPPGVRVRQMRGRYEP